jgi:hypothetical protein
MQKILLIVSFAVLKEKSIKVNEVLDSLGELLTKFLNQNSEQNQLHSINVENSAKKAATILTTARDPNSQTAYKYF